MSPKSLPLILIAVSTVFGQYGPQQGPAQSGDQGDPEDRNHGVARISLMNGDVSVRRGDSGDFVAANVNAPLLGGDSIQTGAASRAEVQFDGANRVRLSAFSEALMGDLRAGAFQVQLARGTATFTVISDTQAQVEVSTANASLKPLQRGAYRISVLEDGTTEFTVRAGEADIYTQRGSQRISAGQTMMLRGNPSDPEYQVVAAIGRDEWDQFNETRDRELARSTAYQHVSRDVPGAEDLDQYGQWRTDPTYGEVWAPNVAADWAPYQSGRWVWEDYYGWTWVSYDPWGWAPYHYGRWYRGPFGWGWVPGPVYGRYGYRPALVGFFGYGGGVGFGFGFGFGNLGWVALAPFESFHPWWGRGYGGGVRVVNNINIYNTYRNARVPNGAMGMSAQQFQSGQFGRYSHPGSVALQNGGVVHGALPVTPGGSHLRFNDRAAGASTRMASAASSQQHFVSRGGFAPVQRQSFTQQRQSVQQGVSGTRPAGETGRGTGLGGGSAAASSSSWGRFGTPSSAAGRTAAPGAAASGASWGRFGSPSTSGQTGSVNAYGRSPSTQQYSEPARNYSGGSAGGSSGRSVQIAPSIVQQHSSPAPQRQSAPAQTRQSAPAAAHSSSGGGHTTGGGHASNSGHRGK